MTYNVPNATEAFSSIPLLNVPLAATAPLEITSHGLVRDTRIPCALLAIPVLAVLAKLDTP